jgi:hypothetical protein
MHDQHRLLDRASRQLQEKSRRKESNFWFVEICKHRRGFPEFRRSSMIPGRPCGVSHPSDRVPGVADQEGTRVGSTEHSAADPQNN